MSINVISDAEFVQQILEACKSQTNGPAKISLDAGEQYRLIQISKRLEAADEEIEASVELIEQLRHELSDLRSRTDRLVSVDEGLPAVADEEGWSDLVLMYVDDGREHPHWLLGYCEHGEHGGHRWRECSSDKNNYPLITHWTHLPAEPTSEPATTSADNHRT